MTLAGTRPPTLDEWNKYELHHRARLAIKPGITYTSKKFVEQAIKENQWYAPAWLNMYRRDFLLENDLFFEKGIYFEDVQMLPRVFLVADVPSNNMEMIYFI